MGKPTTDAAATMGLDIDDWEKKIDLLMKQEKQFEAMAVKMGTSVKVVKDAFTKLGKEQAAQQKEQEKSNKGVSLGTKAMGLFKGALGALGIAFTIGAIVKFGREVMEFGKQTSDAAKTSDLSAESFQRLDATLMKFVDSNDASQAISVLAKTLRDAKNQVPDALRKFDELGISFATLKAKSFDAKTLLEALADGYVKAGDKADYIRRASDTFGDDLARKLEPALAGGGKALKAYGDSASVAKGEVLSLAKEGELALGRLGTASKKLSLAGVGWIAEHVDATINGPKAPPVKPASPPPTPTVPNVAEQALANAQKSRLDYEVELSQAEAKRDLTLSSELDILEAQIKLAQQNAVIERDLGHRDAEAVELAKIRNAELAKSNMLFQRQQELHEAMDQTAVIGLLASGQDRIARIEQMRLGYELRIKDAIRLGKTELASQLKTQEDITGLQQRAEMHARTPRERAEENRERRKKERHTNAQAARERQEGKSGEYESQLNGPAMGSGNKNVKGYEQQISEGSGIINPHASGMARAYGRSNSQAPKSNAMAEILKALEKVATKEITADKLVVPMQ